MLHLCEKGSCVFLVWCTIAMAENSDNVKAFSLMEPSDFLMKGLIGSKEASDELQSKSHLSRLQP